MADTKKVKMHVIPRDAHITIEVSGNFHKRLVGAYFAYINKIHPDNLPIIMTAIEESKVENLSAELLIDATSIQTLIALITNLEQKFTDAGLDKEQEFEIPNEG